MSDVNETSIPDPEAAKAALVRMGVAGQDMVSTIEGHSASIAAIEAGKPWGTSEYGRAFEKQYHAGSNGHGSEFIRTNASKLGTETVDGAHWAYRGLVGAVDTDEALKNTFATDKTNGAGAVNQAYQKAAQGES
jgi:hypothetical protein